MITEAIKNAYEMLDARGWKKMYWAFDIHGTIIKPNWEKGNIPTELYPYALEALQLISARTEIVTLLYTCSLPEEIPQYQALFQEKGIRMDYVNENPEVLSQGYGYYEKKPYFNVLFEDKAGFNPAKDWKKVIEIMKTIEERALVLSD